MCSICAADRMLLAQNYLNGLAATHVQPAGQGSATGSIAPFESTQYSFEAKYYDAFPADGVGDLKPLGTVNVVILTPIPLATISAPPPASRSTDRR